MLFWEQSKLPSLGRGKPSGLGQTVPQGFPLLRDDSFDCISPNSHETIVYYDKTSSYITINYQAVIG